MVKILLIDDDGNFAEDARELLAARGHQVRSLDSAEDALRLPASERFDLILLDDKMPRMSGLEFLEETARRDLRVPVILMTSAHNDSTAIRATNLGAFGYVIKEVDLEAFLAELQPLIDELEEVMRRPAHVPLPEGPAAQEPPQGSALVGRSKPMLKLLQSIGRAARMNETVLILGETGTGKELVAQAIHTNSARQAGPFVPMNCSAFNEQLLDDELFGHEIGAFTHATKVRKGRFEHACGGTVFLDEAGDMPLSLQAKLLRVLENRTIERLGSSEPIRVDVRILAATHCDLPALVRAGKFRQDLFFRLDGISIHLPPLRERKGDIELLARAFLARMFAGGRAPALYPAALEKLKSYDWPGNVRQLQKVLCRAAGVCRGREILPEDIDFGDLQPSRPEAADPLAGLRSLIASAWRSGRPRLSDHLHDLLDRELLTFAQAEGLSEVKLAERLGISRGNLRKRLEQSGLKGPTEEQ
jgi:two-component system nitrogen regulation response regulator GlnG